MIGTCGMKEFRAKIHPVLYFLPFFLHVFMVIYMYLIVSKKTQEILPLEREWMREKRQNIFLL